MTGKLSLQAQAVRAYIERETGLPPCSLVCVGLSGGADSTALLLIMRELGYRLRALHCNFHLRGEESNRDQAFVEELCGRQDVPLSVRHFDTREEAKRRGVSIEMAARDLRYAWFNSQLSALSSQLPAFIAVAHHRDDQAETVLLNLLRGTGIRGLAGMKPRNGQIIRPLLCLSRADILAYLESRGQTYVTDSTNLERSCQRNRVRLDLLPLLRSLNEKAVEHLCLAADNARDSIHYYNIGIAAAFNEVGATDDAFPLQALAGTGRTLLHEWLSGKGFNREQEEEMLCGSRERVGRQWHSGSHVVVRDRQALLLSPVASELAVPRLRHEIVPAIGKTGPGIAYFDADLVKGAVEVRPVRPGDAFVPFGMTGRKLVSDFLTDRKLSRIEKQRQFVAVCGDDVIWLIGQRSDNRFRVTDGTTRILKLTRIPGEK